MLGGKECSSLNQAAVHGRGELGEIIKGQAKTTKNSILCQADYKSEKNQNWRTKQGPEDRNRLPLRGHPEEISIGLPIARGVKQ